MSDLPVKEVVPSDDLLLTKLSPPRQQASLIQRARLFERLNAGLEKKVTLIAAPTGSGKTTLVSTWIAQQLKTDQTIQSAWVTLDENDNDPVRFWRYWINACRKSDPALGKASLAALRTAQQPTFPQLFAPLINELAQLRSRMVVVLDDFHAIHSPDVLSSVMFLIDHLPANLHLVLMARGEPALPLALLRARNELNELGAADLRFSEPEIGSFLSLALPFALTPGAIHLLEERTEGWAAGIRLVTLALQDQGRLQDPEKFIETFHGEHRFVLEYLVSEVLQKQPKPIQKFLLRTCFLDRFCGPLCAEVAGEVIPAETDGGAILERLEQAGLFIIPLGADAGEAWYRYHPLFAEALRHEALQALSVTDRLTIHEKAGRWYAEHGLLVEAIEVALEAGQFGRAVALIEQYIAQRSINEVLTLRRWCDRVPFEVFFDHPVAAFDYALALVFTSDRFSPATAAAIDPLFQVAEKAWSAQPDSARLGEVLTVRGTIAYWQGEVRRSFEYSHRALELLPESELFWRSAALANTGFEAMLMGELQVARNRMMEARAISGAANNLHVTLVAVCQLGEIDRLQGELDRAADNFRQVLAEAVGGEEMLDDQSSAWLGLASIAYARGDLEAAAEGAERALEISLRRLDERVQAQASILLAHLARARGQAARGQALLENLLNSARDEILLFDIRSTLVWLALAEGDLAAGRRRFEALMGEPDRLFPVQRERLALLTARLTLEAGGSDLAPGLLDGLRARAHSQGRLLCEIEILLLEALADYSRADLSRAGQLLAAALSLAQPKGLRRVFLDEGKKMAGLLAAAIPNLAQRSLALFARALLHELTLGQLAAGEENAAGVASRASALIEPLTPQEVRVLRLLAAELPYAEIARELMVSVNTIKTQVRSIYQKLNVNSRKDAREAADRLGLV